MATRKGWSRWNTRTWRSRWSFRETRKNGRTIDYGLQGPTGPQCMHFKFDLNLIVTIMSTDINNDYSVWTLILPDCETGNQVTLHIHTHIHTHTHTHTHTGPPGPSGLYKVGEKNHMSQHFWTAVREVLHNNVISLVLTTFKLEIIADPQNCSPDCFCRKAVCVHAGHKTMQR